MPTPGQRTAKVSFGSNTIFFLDVYPDVLFWTSPLAVDADGHPQCYHPKGSPPGLDYLANAGSSGNWWGIACDASGRPYVQTEDDDAPGFYVSTTALMDGSLKSADPSRYVHSGERPFFVLPSTPKFHSKQTLGDLAFFVNTDNGESSWAVYADIGPQNKIGEGSMKLCERLGLSADPKKGGTEKEIIATVYFPGSTIGWPKSNEELSARAHELFHYWSGRAAMSAAMPQFPWTNFE